MGTRLYVGNLSFGTTDETLKAHFQKIGKVIKADVLMDRETKKSRGFGFVEMATEEAARQAIEDFDGTELDGRRLKVNEAHERQPRR